MKFRKRTLDELGSIVCGDADYFVYRSSSYITRFFEDIDTGHRHDGTTRAYWTAGAIEEILNEPHSDPRTPPQTFLRLIASLMDKADADEGDPDRSKALAALNATLARESFEAFYGDDNVCYLRNTQTKSVYGLEASPHRPLTPAEVERREQLSAYLDKTSEDELIEEILIPLFRQLGFHRISAAGHTDKALEYGKDIWMRYTLPTQHLIYFGIQAKKGKLDAAGVTKSSNANIAEIYNQVLMMIGHEIFDPETGKRALVDHAFIVAGGAITKAARNWLGQKLDATKRCQILFMERDDILNLFVVNNLPLPQGAMPEPASFDDTIPF